MKTFVKPKKWLLIVALAILVFLVKLPCQAQFTWTTNADNTITITAYTGSNTVLVIPSMINAGGTNLLVTGIGTYAFINATNLTTITIPYSVTNLGMFALSVGSLLEINVDADNPSYSGVQGVLFNKAQSSLITCPMGKPGSYSVPSSVTGIGDNAFEFCILTNITIPQSVTSIGAGAFGVCNNLRKLTLPNNVTNIGAAAFQHCISLTNVNIPDGLTTIGYEAFDECSSLTSILIPNSVTSSIGGYMFYDCLNLTSVTIGEKVKSIDDYAFNSCGSLLTIIIPDSVTNIGYAAFQGCRSLFTVTIGSGVTRIADYAFASCYNLTGVYFRGSEPYATCCSTFLYDNYPPAYHVLGAAGWYGQSFAGLPLAIWVSPDLTLHTGTPDFIVPYGITVTGTINAPVIVEASSTLTNPLWVSVYAFTLINGSVYFDDPQWGNFPARFYRIHSP